MNLILGSKIRIMGQRIFFVNAALAVNRLVELRGNFRLVALQPKPCIPVITSTDYDELENDAAVF
jgi:hypothetical protein